MKRITKADLLKEISRLNGALCIANELNEPRDILESAVGLAGGIDRLEKRLAILEHNVALMARGQTQKGSK